MKANDTLDGAVHDMAGFRQHLMGNHDNNFCKCSYGECQKESYFTTRPDLKEDYELKILDLWFKDWANPKVLQKYLKCYDTNIEEATNFIMVCFMEKRIFSRTLYKIAAMSVCLFRNEKGWNFFFDIMRRCGVEPTDAMKQEVATWEAEAGRIMEIKDSTRIIINEEDHIKMVLKSKN